MIKYVEKLRWFTKSLSDFEIIKPDIPYNHMGATLTDSVLQSGLRWETVVKPRLNYLRSNYPQANTTTNFISLVDINGLEILINWTNQVKIKRLKALVKYLYQEKIDTENDLKEWLLKVGNAEKLKEIDGIGDKTVDYLKFLVGIPTAAIDRHLLHFLQMAGINVTNYGEAQEIIHLTADEMKINRSHYDYSIWKYMSDKSKSSIGDNSGMANHTKEKATSSTHQGSVNLNSSFMDVWDYVHHKDSIRLQTSQSKEFIVKAGYSKGKPVIKFYQKKKKEMEYARSYQCCWGQYYNCYGTRFGMYAVALDKYYQDQNQQKVPAVRTNLATNYEQLWSSVASRQFSASSPIHGLTHWKRVLENGLLIAKESGANKELVELFALFHDSCRLNDGKDPEHGKRGAEWVRSLRPEINTLNDELFETLLVAIRDHTHVKHTDNVHIAACWDADRLDLGRVGKIPDPDFMNTEIGKRMTTIGRDKMGKMNTEEYVKRFIDNHKDRISSKDINYMTTAQKKLYEIINQLRQNRGKQLSRADIDTQYERATGKQLNMLPSDFCYNATNSAPDFECKFLLKIGRGLYEFVDTMWSGDDRRIDIEWAPKGKDVPDDLSGLIFTVGKYFQGRYVWDFNELEHFISKDITTTKSLGLGKQNIKTPNYYIAVFGDPNPPERDRVESGVHHPDPNYAPFKTEPGDFLLLYCTAGYDEHAMTIPGVGVVLGLTDSEISYRYIPFEKAILKDEIDNNLEQEDRKKFSNIRFSSHWLFEISRTSFENIMMGRVVEWP